MRTLHIDMIKYKCLICGGLRSQKYDAILCCGQQDVLNVFLCPECRMEHNTPHSAMYCCATETHIRQAQMLNQLEFPIVPSASGFSW